MIPFILVRLGISSLGKRKGQLRKAGLKMYYFIYKWLLLFPIRYRFSLQRRIILVANIKDSCMKLPLILSHRYIISIRHNHMVNQRNIYQCKRLFHPNSGLQICSRGQRKTAGMIMSENRLSSICLLYTSPSPRDCS